MVTNREIRDTLISIRVLSAGLIDQLDLFPSQMDVEAQVTKPWLREFVRATARATDLLVEAVCWEG